MEFLDLGKKETITAEMPTVGKRNPKTYYPSFYCEKKLPLDGNDVGKVIIVGVKLKITSIEKRIINNKEPKYDYRFDVLGMKFPSKGLETVEDLKNRLEKI